MSKVSNGNAISPGVCGAGGILSVGTPTTPSIPCCDMHHVSFTTIASVAASFPSLTPLISKPSQPPPEEHQQLCHVGSRVTER